jgi:hypothetical protein
LFLVNGCLVVLLWLFVDGCSLTVVRLTVVRCSLLVVGLKSLRFKVKKNENYKLKIENGKKP